MKFSIFIFIILFFSSCKNKAQYPEEKYIAVYLVDKMVDKGEFINDKRLNSKDDERIIKSLYNINSSKDSIVYYKAFDSETIDYNTYSLYSLNKIKNTYYLNDKKSEFSKPFKIEFDNKAQSITINSVNIFYLNDSYFNYLKDHLNIPNLADLIEEFLEDYDLVELRNITSNLKYNQKKFRIRKAVSQTTREQASDYIDNWNINFKYNKKGNLINVSKISREGDVNLEKKLLSEQNGQYRYQIYRNFESTLTVDKKISFTNTSILSCESNKVNQVNLGKESRYSIKRIESKVFNSAKFFLNGKEIPKVE